MKGLAEYREDHFAAAADLMKQVVQVPSDPNRTVAARMILAMALEKLNQSAEARSSFAQGSKLAETALPRADGGQWNDQISARIFLREASELVASNNSDPDAK